MTSNTIKRIVNKYYSFLFNKKFKHHKMNEMIKSILSTLTNILSISLPFIIGYIYYYLSIKRYKSHIFQMTYQCGNGNGVYKNYDFGLVPVGNKEIVKKKNFENYMKNIEFINRIINSKKINLLYYSYDNQEIFEIHNREYIIKKLNERIDIVTKIKNYRDYKNRISFKYYKKLHEMMGLSFEEMNDNIFLNKLIEVHTNNIERLKSLKIISKNEYISKYENFIFNNNETMNKILYSKQTKFIDIEPNSVV